MVSRTSLRSTIKQLKVNRINVDGNMLELFMSLCCNNGSILIL